MKVHRTDDTIVALATPPGLGAIGLVRLSGNDALEIAKRIFQGKNLVEAASHTAHFGRIVDAGGRVLDEVLVTVFKTPHAYTGDDTVEISCHGSPYILQQVIDLCLQCGARLAEPGEFTLRAFLNGKMDLTQAEAVADLIASENAAAHGIALRQLRGGFKNEIRLLREELIHFASLVELELDFGEEDVEFANRSDLKDLVHKLRGQVRPLIQSFALGNALKTGVATVIAGRPNAGKSTLLNALLNEERAIVSDIPGTTRDTIEESLNIRGVQFRLVDTAGIREAEDAIEALGVQRTMEKIGQAGIVVYVWDVSGGMSIPELWDDLAQLSSAQRADGAQAPAMLLVCNKMDRNPYFKTSWVLDPLQPEVHPYLWGDEARAQAGMLSGIRISENSMVPVSAKNAMNIEYLKEKLYEAVVGEGVNTDSTVIANARHHDALRRADEALLEVLAGLDANLSGDFMAQDIRRALSYLGEITGEIGVEDLLGNIFGKFCIGK